MKNFADLAASRRSCHDFEPGFTLDLDLFHRLIDTTALTPSGYNAQPWSFVLVQSEEKLKELHQIAYKQDHVLSAGNVVIVLGDREFGQHESERVVSEWVKYRDFDAKQAEALQASMVKNREDWKKREMMLRNCSLAAMSFMYAAEDVGLSTCPMMGFRQLDLKRWLELPENMIPVMMIAIGKGRKAVNTDRLPRKGVKELIWGVL